MDEGAPGILAVIAVGAVIVGLVLLAPPAVDIRVPGPHETVENPARVVLRGLPDGIEVGVRLRDSLGRILAEKGLVARGGRAEALLYFDVPDTDEGALEVFAPSGGEIIARRPVRLSRERGRWVKVFLLDRAGKLFPAVRRIPDTPRVATEALRALLAGPTMPEARAGIWSAAPVGTRLVSLSISGGTATATFAVPDPGAPGLALFGLQVEETLSQFPTITGVEVDYVPR